MRDARQGFEELAAARLGWRTTPPSDALISAGTSSLSPRTLVP